MPTKLGSALAVACSDNFIRALYAYSCDYHSGQWSIGYKMLCLCQHFAYEWDIALPLGTEFLTDSEWLIYNALERKYRKCRSF